MKRCVVTIIAVLLIIAGLCWFFNRSSKEETVMVSDKISDLIAEDDNDVVKSIFEETSEDVTEVQDTDELPAKEVLDEEDNSVVIQGKKLIDAPFIVQAPFGNWDEVYKEACEEASVMVVHKFYQSITSMTQQEMKDVIDEIIPWGLETFGTDDTNAQDTARYFTDYLGYDEKDVLVIYDFTIDDIKAIISEGYPVIVPAAGRELGNRFFRTPGPLYHMTVIVGYDGNEFITNDPGTRNGEGYRYNQNILYNAIHDLTKDKEQILTGGKAMIVVKGKN